MSMFRLAILLATLAAYASAASCSGEPASLDIATTTSVQHSGLLEALIPHFSGATVRIHAAGSGRALAMLADGIVDLVISHAPEAEARFLAEHAAWVYRKIAYNGFVVVGPAGDPARVREARDVVDAFRMIAATRAVFVSRGDESGTHERERSLWKAAGVQPDQAQMRISGQGMAVTLRQTDEQQGYTLSDQATFWQLEHQIGLVNSLRDRPAPAQYLRRGVSGSQRRRATLRLMADGGRWPGANLGVSSAGAIGLYRLARWMRGGSTNRAAVLDAAPRPMISCRPASLYP